MSCSNNEFEHRCRVYLRREQEKLAPDNGLIALLCDAVRCVREYSDMMHGRVEDGPNAGGQRPTASGGTSEPPCSAHDLAADALAYACARTVCDGLLNARSQIADALLDYLNIGCGGPDDVPSWMRQYEQRQKPNVGGERTACPKGSNE